MEDDESIDQAASLETPEETSRDSTQSISQYNLWTYFWNLNSELIPTHTTAQLSVYLITVICKFK